MISGFFGNLLRVRGFGLLIGVVNESSESFGRRGSVQNIHGIVGLYLMIFLTLIKKRLLFVSSLFLVVICSERDRNRAPAGRGFSFF